MFTSNCIVKIYARNRKRAACMFFRSAKTVFINTCVSPIRRFGWPCARSSKTVVSLKLHAMSMRPYTTVWMTARTVRTVIRTVVSCFLTRASMGKSNYYDKMKWQDSIKVIITQNLHQIRNWEFHNMLNGMSTIEMIENLKIENLTENRVIRQFGWPPTMCSALCW